AEQSYQGANFFQILGIRDDELELIRAGFHELSQNLWLDAQAIVLRGPGTLRRGVREFRTDAHEVASDRPEHRAGSLDGDMQSAVTKAVRERDNFRRNHRLAPRYHDVLRRIPAYCVENFCDGVVLAFRLPRGIWRIAPGTAQIAAAGPDENRR